jgi:hypothetical protein
MTVVSSGYIETIDDLVNEMAKAINPAVFTSSGSEQERNFCRLAAKRALLIAAPVLVREAAALAGDNAEIAANIMRLNEIF